MFNFSEEKQRRRQDDGCRPNSGQLHERLAGRASLLFGVQNGFVALQCNGRYADGGHKNRDSTHAGDQFASEEAESPILGGDLNQREWNGDEDEKEVGNGEVQNHEVPFRSHRRLSGHCQANQAVAYGAGKYQYHIADN